MKLKVCGITSLQQLQQLQQLGVDYAGMIFFPASKRFFGQKLSNDAAEIKKLPIQKVGVFVNEGMDKIKSLVAQFGLNLVQLHGDEDAAFCNELQKEVAVIKVFRIANQTNIDEMTAPFQNSCTYFLFDTDTAQYGGSGKSFDWEVLKNAHINKPFFLSGGIGMDSMDKLKSFHHPYLLAIDVNSRFEIEPGLKDMGKLKSFMSELNLYGATQQQLNK